MTSRLDVYLTERGIAPSRHRAAEWIREGRVTVNGQEERKPSRTVPADAQVDVSVDASYVSRAGTKLAHALDVFQIDCGGLLALDVGASTGGFTECLLRRGAKQVWAVDVGHDQLADSLKRDGRVISLEGINARRLTASLLGGRAELATVDVSFISQKLIWPVLRCCLTERARIVSLVKPQFEAGRAALGKSGVIRDPKVHARVLDELRAFAREIGYDVLAETRSPILGGDGNQEFFFLLSLQSEGTEESE